MSTENQSVCAVVVAAGSSRRMGGENKLLLPLCGKPVLAHTLTAFQMCGAVRDIVLVCREQDMEVYRTLAAENGITKLRTLTRGGDTRTESVLAGVSAASEACALVAVHDGARPLVSDEVITQAVDEAAKTGAAAPVVPVKDSIKRIENGKIVADVPRDTLAAVHSPGSWASPSGTSTSARALQSAAASGRSFTDDCAAVEALGQTVSATLGSYENIKVTTPEDIAVAEAFLYRREKK